MKILVVGSGGREHAIVRKLRESPLVTEIFCAPGNGGIAADAVCVPIKAADISEMVSFASEENIDLAVITPDDPLVLGMVDAMNEAGIRTFGPDRAAARIEGSKVFSKALMAKYGIPTAGSRSFSDSAEAIRYVSGLDSLPIVIKADGLALGKGVIIAQSLDEAIAAIRAMLEQHKFGKSGSRIIIEEFMTGPEVSVLAFCDGKTVIPMVSAMDHKRALDGDRGMNTGGMGTVAPNLCYTPKVAKRCMDKIFRPTLAAMSTEGTPFSGCLFFGLMLTSSGPKVIEYNCRFGDPETQVVLPLLKTDLVEIMLAVWEKRLDKIKIEFSGDSAACVVLASGGYPESYETGFKISGLGENGQPENGGATVFHAGTRTEDGSFVTAGGRVLGVTCTDATGEAALAAAYRAAEGIGFSGAHYRRDIGAKNKL